MEERQIDNKMSKSNSYDFSELIDKYYNQNFGTLSKSDFDLIMFKIYYDRLKSYAGKSEQTDVAIAFDLGISKQKVKSLKERVELRYFKKNDDLNWKSEVESLFPKCEKIGDEVQVMIDNLQLRYCIESYLNSFGFGCSYDSNSGNMSFSQKGFICLYLECSDDESVKKKLQKRFKDNDVIEKFTPSFILNMNKGLVCDVMECIGIFVGTTIGEFSRHS